MWAIDFSDTQHGWVVAVGGFLLLTTDGGATWQPGGIFPPYFTSLTISDIKFANQNAGWVVGWDGFVSHTTDGGLTWTNQDIGTTTDHLFSLQVISPTEAWASGRNANLPMNGVVYHTTDGGATWTNETVGPYPYWGYSIAATPDNVWIAGTLGRIYNKGLSPSAIEVQENVLSQTLFSYPNPFHLETTILYNVSRTGFVSLKVYNAVGKQVATLADGNQSAGAHKIVWNAEGFSPGVYYYKFSEGKVEETGKLILQ
jgi:hypothetical protein